MHDVDVRSGVELIATAECVRLLATEQVDDPVVVARLRALAVNPWAGGNRSHLVRIQPTAITGRRVGTPPRGA